MQNASLPLHLPPLTNGYLTITKLMPLQFIVYAEISTTKETLFKAWLNSAEHTNMTGEPATSEANVGAAFTAYNNYIFGKNIELIPFSKIVQSWRTTEFADHEADSIIEISFTDKGENTLVTLIHSNLPAHGERYRQGWEEYYFKPMKKYFHK